MFKCHLAQKHKHLKSLLLAGLVPKMAQKIKLPMTTGMVTNQKTTVQRSAFFDQRFSQDWVMWQQARQNFISWSELEAIATGSKLRRSSHFNLVLTEQALIFVGPEGPVQDRRCQTSARSWRLKNHNSGNWSMLNSSRPLNKETSIPNLYSEELQNLSKL